MMSNSSTKSSSVLSVNSKISVKGSLRILMVRPDRLGDVILSTPVFEMVKRYYPQSHVVALLRSEVIPVLKGLSSLDDFIVFDPLGRHAGFKGFFRLVSELRALKFQVAIVLQTQWKIALAVFLAGIRYRVGPLSKVHSFLFYNKGIRQRRSHVEMHETDYNLQLLRPLGIRVGSRSVSTEVRVDSSVLKESQEWLKKKGWTPRKDLVLVHPGMGGSALNWPESHYQELVRSLIEAGKQVLITAGPTEWVLMDRMESFLGSLAERALIYRGEAGVAVDFWAGLCSYADVVVAPSTGPLHIAVALGKRVVTFYPPIRVQSAVRWGPYQREESHASVLVPQVFCGQDFNCRGSLCHYFPCMKSLTVKQTLAQVEKQLSQNGENQKDGPQKE